MGTWVISFGGFAALYAALACLSILGFARLIGRFPGWHMLPFLFVTLTFIMLTQHPFPAPGSLNCPVATAEPRFVPFQVIIVINELIRQDAAWVEWVKSRTIAATIMNFSICFIIGLCLPAPLKSGKRAALFGAALTCGVELSQLTGIWGTYPCAYRQFNVDDLLMNFTGVCVGAFALNRWSANRDKQSSAIL